MPNEKALRDVVRVYPGSDPQLAPLKSVLSRTQIEGICDKIRDLYVWLLRDVSSCLLEAAPKNIPVFLSTSHTDPQCHLYSSLGQLESGAKKNLLPRLRGITVPKNHSDPAMPNFTRLQGHELLHVLTNVGLPAQAPVTEAVVARLEKHYFGPRTDRIEEQHPWNVKGGHSTSGLCGEDVDIVSYRGSRGAWRAMYMTAYRALDDVSPDDVWQLCHVLAEKSLIRGFMPTLSETRETVEDILGSQADCILRNPCFNRLNAGNQAIVIPTSAGDIHGNMAMICSFSASARSQYGTRVNGVYQNVNLQCEDLTRTIPLYGLDVNGQTAFECELQIGAEIVVTVEKVFEILGQVQPELRPFIERSKFLATGEGLGLPRFVLGEKARV